MVEGSRIVFHEGRLPCSDFSTDTILPRPFLILRLVHCLGSVGFCFCLMTLVDGGIGSPGNGSASFPAAVRGEILPRSEEHTSELQSRFDLVCRLLLEKKNPLRYGPTRA